MSSIPRISFQGAPGAYSDIVTKYLYPDGERLGCGSFKDALQYLREGRSDYAVIPVNNTIAGPVTNAIALLREAEYTVIKTYTLPIHHCLLALPQAKPEDLRSIHSHWQALMQCQINIKKLGLQQVETGDTAGAAKQVAAEKDITKAAIASSVAAEAYGLKILQENFEDNADNKTLFLSVAINNNPHEENLGSVKDVLAQLGL